MMKNKLHLKTLIITSLVFGLMGCGGDDSGLLDEPAPPTPPPTIPTTESLRALPKAVMLIEGDTLTVDVADAVLAVNISSWALTNVQDSNGLGEITQETETGFDYSAKTSGIASLPYEIQGGGLTSTSTVLVAINAKDTGEPDVNTPPSAKNVILETLSNQSVNVDLNQFILDINNDALQIKHLVTASGRFTLGEDGYTVTFQPAGFVGVDQAVYSVDDGQGGYALASIVITSREANPSIPNTLPVAKDFAQNIDSKTLPTWSIDLATLGLISDADGDTLSIAHIYSSNNRAIKSGATTIDYTPGSFTGIDQFTYIITDGKQGYAAGSISVTVSNSTPGNAIPTAKPIVIKNILDNDFRPILIDVTTSVVDTDNDELQLIDVFGENGTVAIDASNPLVINYTPPSPSQGLQDDFTYVVTDGKGGIAMSTVKVEFIHHNPNAPVANIAQLTTLHDEAVSINLEDYISDVETANSELTVSNLQGVALPATVTLAGKTITYTPNGFMGTALLTYTVSDGELSTQGIVVIGVNPDADHTVIAKDFTVRVEAGSTFATRLDWLSNVSTDATDVDGLTLTLVSVRGEELGVVTIVGDTLNYTPIEGKFGQDKLIYTVKDGHAPTQFAHGKITINVEPHEAPEITALTIEGKPTIGSTLTAKVTCTTCDTTKYQYKWMINGLTAGTASTYTYQTSDSGFNIRLEVTGEDAYKQKTAEYGVYEVSKVEKIYLTDRAAAAVKEDGNVVTWGKSIDGGDSAGVDFTGGVQTIYSTVSAFAAVKKDGSVVTWGDANNGGDSASVDFSGGVETIYSTAIAFAALKKDGSVVTWGNSIYGGDSAGVDFSGGVEKIYSNDNAFAAVKKDGSVVTWGDITNGGDSAGVDFTGGVEKIYSNGYAFAAVKKDGNVVTWGNITNGGDSSGVDFTGGVEKIYSTRTAFAAVKKGGSVVTWGSERQGGNSAGVNFSGGVEAIYSNQQTFAAIKKDGNVVTWGNSEFGGNSGWVDFSGGVKEIFSNRTAFAALKNDGSVVTWGHAAGGGSSSAVASQLASDVVDVFSKPGVFAAFKSDGSLIFWGIDNWGADTSTVSEQISSGVSSLYGTELSVIALKECGTVVTWGDSYVGDSSAVADQLIPSFSKVQSSIM
ncbi:MULTISPECIES: RCC1 domain-containing protein [unclassified Shewanella]|uniref:RCC1 domain-containing protein n=1 Tax=unclassified Shewanella TaxID=196818 RepID=UPI0022BA4D53|nr:MULTISPECIES: tandem-95 repeat protein [unclassified Shewanella]MEC4737121.1 tandem-95 repeat protein [Shewanella sp. E94]WBJ95686.1 tandem-95 repeat protein [Shewanella sp. MTB7]